jgi:myo-inositol-1(or 4)-monophosphatase
MQYAIATPEMRFALNFAERAADLIRERFTEDNVVDWKQNETPITDVDIELNKRFITEATKQFPGYSVLGEEESAPIAGAEWTWIIDPVDGTQAFVQGIPLSTCCIALLRNGIPELGVIVDPMGQRMFYAQKGRGAYLNDKRIHVSDTTTLERQFVHMDTLKTGDRRLLPLCARLFDKNCTPIIVGAIQYAVALACAGRVAGIVFSLPSFWDAACAYIIGTEAGAVVTDLQGNEQRYDEPTKGFILGNPTIHKELLAMVTPYLA